MHLRGIVYKIWSAKLAGVARASCVRRVYPRTPSKLSLTDHCSQDVLTGRLCVAERLSGRLTAVNAMHAPGRLRFRSS